MQDLLRQYSPIPTKHFVERRGRLQTHMWAIINSSKKQRMYGVRCKEAKIFIVPFIVIKSKISYYNP